MVDVEYTTFNDLVGKTLVSAERFDSREGNEGVRFILDDGSIYVLIHYQDCCENVSLEDIVGDLQSLVGSPITLAEEAYADGGEDQYGTSTWSYYRFATANGYVTIRFYGSSNGYYSETACLYKAFSGDEGGVT